MLSRDAVTQFVDRKEQRQAFQQEARRAWETYQATGQHVPHDPVDGWLARLERGETDPAPECPHQNKSH